MNVRASTPHLSVVVPVFNGGPEIVENVEVIREAVVARLGGRGVEVIVVSDGSIDGTAERLLQQGLVGVRVIHYDRNLGKGYAVKAGSLAATGDWIGLCDSDLDLDPSALPAYLEAAIRERQDIVVGSKRHPESVVHYPLSRRVGSWGYQQLIRFLFRLNVRDTQVGLKVFSRDVADEVMPLLLVKRFAFDLELLAVSTALGRGRIRELPITLAYRFTGSGVRSRAVARALWDTAAVFYRLRILRTYQRKRRLVGDLRRSRDYQPRVVLVGVDNGGARNQDYPFVEVAASLCEARAEVVACCPAGSSPAGNWISASVPFLARENVAAVVCASVAPLDGSIPQRAGAASLESRLAPGSRRVRYVPGNVRVVDDHPAEAVVAKTADLRSAAEAGVPPERFVEWLAMRGRETVYTPETVVVVRPPAAIKPVVSAMRRHGRARGAVARATRGSSISGATALALLPAACGAAGSFMLAAGHTRRLAPALIALYGVALAGAAALGAVRYRSQRVGLLVLPTLVYSHASYLRGFVVGIVSGDPADVVASAGVADPADEGGSAALGLPK
jgi:glycosyltransferase involved in cell wall biosynthesis